MHESCGGVPFRVLGYTSHDLGHRRSIILPHLCPGAISYALVSVHHATRSRQRCTHVFFLVYREQASIDHYHAEIDGLLAAGIVPMVTLLHFTHPLWLEERGGFEDDGAPAAFLSFARRMYQEYGGKVRLCLCVCE